MLRTILAAGSHRPEQPFTCSGEWMKPVHRPSALAACVSASRDETGKMQSHFTWLELQPDGRYLPTDGTEPFRGDK